MHNHGFLIKYYILRTNALHKILGLLRRRERWAACAAVRFLRQCMGTKDDFYLRHITKNSAILPVLEAYERNAGRRNLLDSAVLEMIDFIAQQKPSGILEHLVEKHAEKLRGIGGARGLRPCTLSAPRALRSEIIPELSDSREASREMRVSEIRISSRASREVRFKYALPYY